MKKNITLTLVFLLFLANFPGFSLAQIKIDSSRTPADMVKEVFIGSGIKVKDVIYKGSPHAIATFTSEKGMPDFSSGIIMSTGYARSAATANNSTKTSGYFAYPGDKHIISLVGSRSFDAALLDFDFMTDKDSVAFNFIFASEEYNEMLSLGYQDAIAIVISGGEYGGGQNLAVVPGTEIPINCNTINVHENRKYYRDNNPFDLNGKAQDNLKAKLNQDILNNFQFDGYTRTIGVGARVKPKAKYHIRVAISDGGDGNTDSAIIMEGGSFKSHEQWVHVLERKLAEEKRIADSIARAQFVADSLAYVQHVADSIAAAIEQARADSLAALSPDSGDVEVTDEPLEDVYLPRDPMDFYSPPRKGDENEYKAMLLFRDIYDLEDSSMTLLEQTAAFMKKHPDLNCSIFIPGSMEDEDVNLRYDLVRLELIKAGVKSDRIFRNGNSFTDSRIRYTSLRAELWLRM